MKMTGFKWLLCSTVLLAGCQSDGSHAEADKASQAQTKTVAVTDEALVRRGKLMFLMCRSCHSVEKGGRHQTGPNLHGLFGAEAGKKEGFAYSEVMAGHEAVWTEETLDKFLIKPSSYLPGTKMAFFGMPKEKDRQALIAYLKDVTQ